MRPGDWMCPSCNNHNYADKIRCANPNLTPTPTPNHNYTDKKVPPLALPIVIVFTPSRCKIPYLRRYAALPRYHPYQVQPVQDSQAGRGMGRRPSR